VSEPTSPAAPPPVFAEPTALGLLGLAIGCAALLPVAFGFAVTPAALRTSAMFCLLFGGGGQMIAGLMGLANKNLLGGTMFTTFAFNWIMNWWALAGLSEGKLPDATVILSVDACFLVIFVVLAYAFAFHSKLLFAFLADICALYVFRILRELTHSPAFALPVALATVVLMLIALWLAFAVLVNGTAGKPVFKIPGPLLTPAKPAAAPAT
jgi:succinate-acetate transporter protein